MKKIILDASVSIKWFFQKEEILIEEAQMLLSDYLNKRIILMAPNIWVAEICNILPRKIKNISLWGEIFSELKLYRIIDVDISLSLASIAFELMNEFSKISFYDASYHALALKEGGVFVTADKKYYDMTKKKGAIMWLGDYGG